MKIKAAVIRQMGLPQPYADSKPLSIEEVEEVVETAIGGRNITRTIEGRERFPVNVRYSRELRSDFQLLDRVLVAAPSGAQVPLGQLARLSVRPGPPLVRSEAGELVGYVYVDVAGRDLGGYVADAMEAVNSQVQLPSGYHLVWSGQYEYMQRAKERLKYVIPLTLFIIVLLLYMPIFDLAGNFQ